MTTYSGPILSGQPDGEYRCVRKFFCTRRRLHVLLLALGLSLPLAVPGITRSDVPPLPNVDKRTEIKGRLSAQTSTQRQAIQRLHSLVPKAQVDEDSLVGIPTYIRTQGGFLTGPQGVGGAVSARTAGALPVKDPYCAVKGFLNEHTALFGYGAEVLEAARVKREYVTAHNGLRSETWIWCTWRLRRVPQQPTHPFRLRILQPCKTYQTSKGICCPSRGQMVW